MRFRKSINLCKGLKVNFSKSGVSVTLGVPGMSVNIGKRGAYLNTGIPGTGIHYRKKIKTDFLDAEKEQNNEKSDLETVDFDASEEFICIHSLSPKVDTLLDFKTALETLDSANESSELEKDALESAIAGKEDYIETAITNWLETICLPVDFDLQFEYEPQTNAIFVDLDLPEIKDLPQEKTVELKSGTVKQKKKTSQELKNDYIKCVFGLSIFFASHLYNISPCINDIVISGYTQRRHSKTGDLQDHYVYSIKFKRALFETTNLACVDPFEFCMEFENRCNVTKTMHLRKIVPFEVEL